MALSAIVFFTVFRQAGINLGVYRGGGGVGGIRGPGGTIRGPGGGTAVRAPGRRRRHQGLWWTCKSVRRLAQALQTQVYQVNHTLAAELLNDAGYSLQGNRKTTEGESHPDRDAQFGDINK
jgi:Rhodopirellula transposase DDE domain